MRELLLGLSAFALFMLGDLNAIKWKAKMLRTLFFLGCILLAYSTVVLTLPIQPDAPTWRLVLFGGTAACFFALLLYSLFFAIPFTKTYIAPGSSPKVCRTGMYGMCRHPGVLWFAGMYLFLYLANPSAGLLAAAVTFSSANLLYVVWQDIYAFPRMFEDYADYRLQVPFLIPRFKRSS